MSFAEFIDWLTAASAVITAVNIYLMVNKIWGRKHIKDVAESLSVAAYTLSFVLAVPFFLKFLMFEADYVSVIVYGLWMALYALYVLIGAGVWVAGKRDTGLFRKFLAALRTERDEIGTLINALSQPASAEHVIRILGGVAGIDRHVDERERALIETITESWGLKISEAEWARIERADVSFAEVRDSLSQYLRTRPSADEAGQLLDLISHMVRADEDVSEEEQLLLDEVEAVIGHYVDGGDADAPRYEALLVPQTDAQTAQIAALFEDAVICDEQRLGGHAYPLGQYFSEAFAEAIAQPYR
ncbi:MAG: TerB family tellurite resistance protein [Magnetovibrio sp.]|nr:TerB family tellurite resistance protein [Magnetovibrio sp.]